MILWTIQTIEAWNTLQNNGVLHGNQKYVDPDFICSYQWLMTQMTHRIAPKPHPDIFPIWAWYQWQGEKRRKPDLRSRAHLAKGTHGVRIEFEILPQMVLLSDFDLWHYVLNNWYLSLSLLDAEQFDSTPQENHQDKITKSWERIFDINWEQKDITWLVPEKSIQATFWLLQLENVRDVTFFCAR